MPKVRSYIPVDYPAKDINAAVVQDLGRRGYGVLRKRSKMRWRFHHPTEKGDSPFASDHDLDLRISDQARGIAVLDFRFQFPAHRPAHQAEVNDWVVRFRDRLISELFKGPVPGIVSADGSRVEFEGPSPPFYRTDITNFLGVRSHRESRVVFVSSLGLSAFGFLFLALYLLGELDIRYVVCGSALFFGLPLLAAVSYLQFHTSVRYPKAVAPTLEGVRLRFRSRELLVPWNRIVGKTQPTGMSASGPWESRISWTDDRGRIRSFQVSLELTEWIDGCRGVARTLTGRRREVHLVWNAAPPGTHVLVSHRKFTPHEMQAKKLHARFPLAGILTPVYVTEETDRAIARSYLSAKAYDAKTLRAIADTAVEREYWDIAGDVYRQVLEKAPTDADSASRLAGCLLKEGKASLAREFLTSFFAGREPTANAWVMLSVIAEAEGDGAAAQAHLGRAVEIDPDNLDALHIWFDYVVGMGGLGQAVAELETLAQTHEKHWGPPPVLAVRTSQLGERVRAIEYFEKALSRQMNDTTVTEYLNHLTAAGEVVRAVEVADRVLDNPPDGLSGETWLVVAAVYETARSREKARRTLARINLQKHPDLADEVQNRLAEV